MDFTALTYSPPSVSIKNDLSMSYLGASCDVGISNSNTLGLSNKLELDFLNLWLKITVANNICYSQSVDISSDEFGDGDYVGNSLLTGLVTSTKVNLKNFAISGDSKCFANESTHNIDKIARISAVNRDLNIYNKLLNPTFNTLAAAALALVGLVPFSLAIGNTVYGLKSKDDQEEIKNQTKEDATKDQQKSPTYNDVPISLKIAETTFLIADNQHQFKEISISDSQINARIFSFPEGTEANSSMRYSKDTYTTLISYTCTITLDDQKATLYNEMYLPAKNSSTIDFSLFDFKWFETNLSFSNEDNSQSQTCKFGYMLRYIDGQFVISQYHSSWFKERSQDQESLTNLTYQPSTESIITQNNVYQIKSLCTTPKIAIDTLNNIWLDKTFSLPYSKTISFNLQGSDPNSQELNYVVRGIYAQEDSSDLTNLSIINVDNYFDNQKVIKNLYTFNQEELENDKGVFSYTFLHGVLQSLDAGISFDQKAEVTIGLKYDQKSAEYTLTLTMQSDEDNKELLNPSSWNNKPFVRKSKRLENLLNRTYVWYFNNFNKNAYKNIKYCYLFFTLIFDETNNCFMFKEIPLSNYHNFYQTLTSSNKDDQTENTTSALTTLDAILPTVTAGAVVLGLLSAAGISAVLTSTQKEKGINLTSKNKGILFKSYFDQQIPGGDKGAITITKDLFTRDYNSANPAPTIYINKPKDVLHIFTPSTKVIKFTCDKTVLSIGNSVKLQVGERAFVNVDGDGITIKYQNKELVIAQSEINYNDGGNLLKLTADKLKYKNQELDSQ